MLVAEFDNDVNPVTQEFLEDGDRPWRTGGRYAAVVIEMDTPGGLATSMRKIVKAILAAPVPVVVYVAPRVERRLRRRRDRPGRRRAGDGAADEHRLVDTDLGVRRGRLERPAQEGDQRRRRLRRRAGAGARSQRRSRRGDGAGRRELRGARGARRRTSSTSSPHLPALLEPSTARDSARRGRRSQTAGAAVERVEMSLWKRALDLLIDPNVIALMLSVGLIGIVVELWNPGLVFPGTVGAISLIVGLYGLQVLPVSVAGVLLLVLARRSSSPRRSCRAMAR